MQSIPPETGAPETVLDPEGKVFRPLTVAVYRDTTNPKITVALSRWQPTDEERAQIAAGEDFYVAQLTDSNAVSALSVHVGPSIYLVGKDVLERAPHEDPPQWLVVDEPPETIPTDSEGAE